MEWNYVVYIFINQINVYKTYRIINIMFKEKVDKDMADNVPLIQRSAENSRATSDKSGATSEISQIRDNVSQGLFDEMRKMHKQFDMDEKAIENEGPQFSQKAKSQTLVAVLTAMLIGNMQVSNLSIVLPNHVDNFDGWKLTQ